MATINNEIGTLGEIRAESQEKRWQSRFINITLWGIKFPDGENMFGEQKQCGHVFVGVPMTSMVLVYM